MTFLARVSDAVLADIRIGAFLLLAAWLTLVQVSANVDVARFSLDIPTGPAVETVSILAHKTETTILFAASTAGRSETRAVKGVLSVQEALDIMLEATPLVAVPVSGGKAFGIVKRAEKGRGKNSSEKTRKTTKETVSQTNMNLKEPKKSRRRGTLIKGLLALTVVGSPSSLAQDDKPSDENVFELSPFSVDASTDQGYRATNTLAGTRLNSNLADLASSVSVFTKEFLDDVGATNIQDAYLYSVNTENENEYARNDTEGHDVSSTNVSRVRGLVANTNTRGFFDTNFRADTYNTERFTLARGPNSILYGIGSPAGLMNATLKRAKVNDDSLEVSHRFDSEGGARTMLDVNKALIEGKLAIRFAGVDQELETWKDPEVDDESRRYGAITFQPHDKTTIRANYEHMKNTRSKARGRLAKEEISHWEASGRPLYDSFNDRVTYDNGATWQSEIASPLTGEMKALSALNEDEQHALGFDRDNGSKFRQGESRTYMHGHLEVPASEFSVIEDPETRAIYEKMGYQALIFLDSATTVGDPDRHVPWFRRI